MKKLFALLVIALSAVGASGQGVYKIAKSDKFMAGQEITSVPNIKMTFGNDTYNDVKKYSLFDYSAYVAGRNAPKNGDGKTPKNGDVPSKGTFYKFEPSIDGILEFTFIIDKAKILTVSENGSFLQNLFLKDKDNNILDYTCGKAFSETDKKYGVGTINVKANNTYYVYGEGTKMGFFGFKFDKAELNVTDAKYATYCSLTTSKVPEGLAVYTAKYNEPTGKVVLTTVSDGIIPANTGVILCGKASNYTMSASITALSTLTDNELVGVTADYTLTDKDYILVNDGGVVKFGKATVGTTLVAGKVYLPIENPNAAKIISMDFDGTTGINAVETASDKDDAYYTLSGVKTLKPTKGMLYIHNGKKYIAK